MRLVCDCCGAVLLPVDSLRGNLGGAGVRGFGAIEVTHRGVYLAGTFRTRVDGAGDVDADVCASCVREALTQDAETLHLLDKNWTPPPAVPAADPDSHGG